MTSCRSQTGQMFRPLTLLFNLYLCACVQGGNASVQLLKRNSEVTLLFITAARHLRLKTHALHLSPRKMLFLISGASVWFGVPLEAAFVPCSQSAGTQ